MESLTLTARDGRSCELVCVADRGEAYRCWIAACLQGRIRKPAILVHFGGQPDIAPPDALQPLPATTDGLASIRLRPDEVSLAAVGAGLVDSILLVCPDYVDTDELTADLRRRLEQGTVSVGEHGAAVRLVKIRDLPDFAGEPRDILVDIDLGYFAHYENCPDSDLGTTRFVTSIRGIPIETVAGYGSSFDRTGSLAVEGGGTLTCGDVVREVARQMPGFVERLDRSGLLFGRAGLLTVVAAPAECPCAHEARACLVDAVRTRGADEPAGPDSGAAPQPAPDPVIRLGSRLIPALERVTGETVFDLDDAMPWGFLKPYLERRFRDIATRRSPRGEPILPAEYLTQGGGAVRQVAGSRMTYDVRLAYWRAEHERGRSGTERAGVITPHGRRSCRLCRVPAGEQLFRVSSGASTFLVVINRHAFLPHHVLLVSEDPSSQGIGGRAQAVCRFLWALGSGYEAWFSSSGLSHTIHFHAHAGKWRSRLIGGLREGRLGAEVAARYTGFDLSRLKNWPMDALVFRGVDAARVGGNVAMIGVELMNIKMSYGVLFATDRAQVVVVLVPVGEPRPAALDRIDPDGLLRVGAAEAGGALIVSSEAMLNRVLQDPDAFPAALEAASYSGLWSLFGVECDPISG
ncbi:MAG: hypothetical protein JXR37_17780 [Kiritimatiellae bacterium]|nr:hypothetical protein [Kiritimatiellia bacterium]